MNALSNFSNGRLDNQSAMTPELSVALRNASIDGTPFVPIQAKNLASAYPRFLSEPPKASTLEHYTGGADHELKPLRANPLSWQFAASPLLNETTAAGNNCLHSVTNFVS